MSYDFPNNASVYKSCKGKLSAASGTYSGSARLTFDYNAISVQLQLQLPTGTELGKNMLLTRYVRMKTTDKKLDQLLNHLHRLINAKFVGSLLGLAKH